MYVSYRIYRRNFYHTQTIFPSGFSALSPSLHCYFEILLLLKITNFGYTKEQTFQTIVCLLFSTTVFVFEVIWCMLFSSCIKNPWSIMALLEQRNPQKFPGIIPLKTSQFIFLVHHNIDKTMIISSTNSGMVKTRYL